MKKIFWWTIMLVGVSILYWDICLVIESKDAVHWPQTKGKVVSSLLTIEHLPGFINISDDPLRWYGVDVQYEYSVGDNPYLSHRVAIQDIGVRSPRSALSVMNKYRKLHEVTVYYNPADPRQAVLEPANIGDIFIPMIVAALLAFLGMYFIYEQSLSVKTSGKENHLYLGDMYLKKGKFELALNEFNKSIEDNPGLSDGYKSRGELYLQQGLWDQAIVDFDQFLMIDPTIAHIHFNRAKAYLGKKRYDKAWEGMLKAMEMGYDVEPELLEEIKKGL